MLERFYELRDYQLEGIAQIIELRRQGHKHILRQQPTGTGKSLELLEMAVRAMIKGNSVLMCVPYPHLVDNMERYFIKMGIQPNIIQGTRKVKNPSKLITIACVPSLVSRVKKGYKLDSKLVLVDESQHIMAESWYQLTQTFKNTASIYWTATPQRLDGQGFDDVCTALVPGKQVKWFIDKGYLAPYRYLESPYTREEGDRTVLAGKLVDEWLKEAELYPTLVYAATIEDSKAIVAEYNAMAKARYGKEIAIHLDGSMSKKYVNAVLAEFGKRVTIISTVNMINEGADLPGCWCVQLASFSTSLTKIIQRWGRVLRHQEGKVAVILDHVGLSSVHGYPDDYREWSLKGWIDPERLKLYCYFCGELLARDKRAVTKTEVPCPHCAQLNVFERESREGGTGTRGGYDTDPDAKLIEVTERRQTRQIKKILREREKNSYKSFWAIYQALVLPDLELSDFSQLVVPLQYKPGYAHKLYEIYKVLHTPYTDMCYTESSLAKAVGANNFWATYCKIHNLEDLQDAV